MSEFLTYKNYLATVHFSAEDDVFVGKVLTTADLISFEGSSVRELKKAFHEAVDDYLELCEELGKEPDKTYKGTFNVRVPAELHKDAAVFAATKNISLNDFIKTAIDFALSHKKELTLQLR
ncbi:type II toxin-antitoxin system HicB family antitoxin [Flavihumibacter petaseus]|nr:type II toxin-antitoxin system HicB family antitoxin [Flavihumibacter petaseus]